MLLIRKEEVHLHNIGCMVCELLQCPVITDKEIEAHDLQADQFGECSEESCPESKVFLLHVGWVITIIKVLMLKEFQSGTLGTNFIEQHLKLDNVSLSPMQSAWQMNLCEAVVHQTNKRATTILHRRT